jgi:2-polyprenyl-3-methyl-5-hydroxy-6-metoxy-1,4-benzoquinol methylase
MTFPYRTADYEEVSCNLCGGTDVEPLGWRDRNLLPVRTVMCKHDGFIFISPRMTSTWYARYYDGEYRRQMSAYHRMPMAHRPEVMIEHQLRHGRWIAAYLRRNGVAEVGSILDIGSSTGGLLRALAEEFKGASVQGVEPSGEEAEFASRNGVPTRVGLFEELDFGEERFDLIVCSQTFNHLLNPRLSVEKVRRLLRPNGVLFLECMDFFRLCEVQGAFFNAVQIDHVSMFVPDTLKAMCEAAGLEVIGSSVLSDRDQPLEVRRAQRAAGAAWCHTRFLASPGVPRPPQAGYQKVRAEIDRLALAPIKTLLKMELRPVRRLTDLTRWRWRVDWWLRYGVE